MQHARPDYAHIQDPHMKIPLDEPVMLFRAQDKYAPKALRAYAKSIYADPMATEEARKVADVVTGWADTMQEYANSHVSKSPDL